MFTTLHRLTTVLLLLAASPRPYAQEAEPAVRRDIVALEAARDAKDLNLLESLIRTNSAKWETSGDTASYVEFMFAACSELSSYDLGSPPQQATLLNQYALAVLTNGPKLSLKDQVRFVGFLVKDPIEPDEAAWRNLRERKAQLWLETWNRVATAIDQNFDFADRPVIHVRPPSASGLPAGVAPEAIADPKLRGEYKAAVTENQAKIYKYDEQYWLKQNAQAFFRTAGRYLVNAYSKPPEAKPELDRLLRQFVNDDGAREKLLEAVKKSESQ